MLNWNQANEISKRIDRETDHTNLILGSHDAYSVELSNGQRIETVDQANELLGR